MKNNKEYKQNWYQMNKQRVYDNFKALKTDLKEEDLMFYKERILSRVRSNLVPRMFHFKFKKWAGEYVIDKDNQKFLSEDLLIWFFTKSYLQTCQKLFLKKFGEFYKIDRENALIEEGSDIDTIIRIVETNRRKGMPRKYIILENGKRINIEFDSIKKID